MKTNGSARWHRARPMHKKGFTLIELMILVAIITIILTLALPVLSNYRVRTKVVEALSLANTVKNATSAICVERPSLTELTIEKTGPVLKESLYVRSITVTGTCIAPVITITTQNMGLSTDPVITLTGDFPGDSARANWTCTANVLNIYVPKECRS